MAEITAGEGRNKRKAGVRKMKRASTRVDLTPMVDLGFLLITFFIFTTSLSEAKVMNLTMPDDKGPQMPVKMSGALTILLGKGNFVNYYEGDLQNNGANIQATTLEKIRQVLIDKKHGTPKKDMYVIIKPGKESVYKNLVDVMDEMTINDIKGFALTDITNEEEQQLSRAK